MFPYIVTFGHLKLLQSINRSCNVYLFLLEETEKEIFKPCNKMINCNISPGPRQAGQINVAFTPREFPTPCRESKLPEEQEVQIMNTFYSRL